MFNDGQVLQQRKQKKPWFFTLPASQPLRGFRSSLLNCWSLTFLQDCRLRACGEGTVAADVCTERHGWVMRRVKGPTTSFTGARPPELRETGSVTSCRWTLRCCCWFKNCWTSVFNLRCRGRATVIRSTLTPVYTGIILQHTFKILMVMEIIFS